MMSPSVEAPARAEGSTPPPPDAPPALPPNDPGKTTPPNRNGGSSKGRDATAAPVEVDPRPHWFGIIAAIGTTVGAIIVVGLSVQPESSAGLVDLVIAATAFPAVAVWASRISSIELVQSTARSSKARNELVGIAISSLREDIRLSAELQGRAIVDAIETAQASGEEGTRALVSEIRALGETISRVGEEEVRALGEARQATERQADATRALAQLQVQAEERARPQLHVQTQVRSHWLFFRHNWLMVANTAGRARGITVEYRFLQQNNWSRIPVTGFDLNTQEQWQVDIGDVNATGGSNRVWVLMKYRDDANRQHVATVDLPLGSDQWVRTVTRPID
jgi:hypothetical protein